MPRHTRSKTDKAVLSQLALPLDADLLTALDQQQREIVLAVLARLLLEAAGMVPSDETADDVG